MTANDSTLSAPVGIGQPNHPDDVRQLQHLLNRHLTTPNRDGRLAEDGAFGPLTQTRLTAYQRDSVRLAHPDGVADPDGPTMQSLAEGHLPAPLEETHGDPKIDAYSMAPPEAHETAKTRAWIKAILPAAQAVHEK